MKGRAAFAATCIAALAFLGAASSGYAQEKDLFEIVKSGSLQQIRAAIKKGADVNAREEHGWTPLIQAAYFRDHRAVEALLSAGADVNARDDRGGTALISAAMNGEDPEVVELLMAAGADVKARDGAGCTALDFARRNASLEGTAAFKRLDEATRSAYARSKDLFELVRYGPLQNVRAAIARGADVNARDECDQSPLQIALYYNKEPGTVAALLKAGADANARMKNGSTPFMYAAATQRPETIAAFLAAGADANAVDDRGFTPLMLAAMGGESETIDLLLGAGADARPRNLDGKTALDFARVNAKLRSGDAYKRLEAATGSPP